MTDICIIGGGAAGLTAAITAKESNPYLSVLIVEKKPQVGKKLLTTGNGKCNVTNTACGGYKETVDFFGNLGVLMRKDDSGRMYPYTEDARTIRDALLTKARNLGVEIMTSAEVLGISRQRDFSIDLGNKIIESRMVLVATGGKSAPQTGSTGDGFRFARAFGHNIRRLIPVLTAIETVEKMEKLAGVRAKAKVSLEFEGREIFSEEGEVQFTATGISGICVFNMSRYMLLPEGKKVDDGFEAYKIYIDFFPEYENLQDILTDRIALGFSGERLLEYMVKTPVIERIMEICPGGDVCEIAGLLKRFPLSPKGAKGWNFAQVTKGGVPFDEVDAETMESKLVKDFYFAGEVLDYDGPCGGFNLQNAWETGAKAGRGMARGKVDE